MRKNVEQMTREQLVAALPKRLLAMVLSVAFLFALAANLALITVATDMSTPWLVATLLVVLTSPIWVTRMFQWTLAPARERVRRRRHMMCEALSSVTWSQGDYEV